MLIGHLTFKKTSGLVTVFDTQDPVDNSALIKEIVTLFLLFFLLYFLRQKTTLTIQQQDLNSWFPHQEC